MQVDLNGVNSKVTKMWYICVTQLGTYYLSYVYLLPVQVNDTGRIEVSLPQNRTSISSGATLYPAIINQRLYFLIFAEMSFGIVISANVVNHIFLLKRACDEL